MLGSGAIADSGWIRSREIDLLALIDLKHDSISGEWTLENGVLSSTGKEHAARVVIPYIPPEEYDLVIEAVRTDGTDALTVGLVSGGRQFVHAVDGYTDEGKVLSGFEMLDGKIARDNESRRDGQVFTNGIPAKLSYRIRRGHIQFVANGKSVLDWKGDFKRLTIRPDYGVMDARVLSIGAWMSHFRVTRMGVYPVSNGGRFLRKKQK